MKIHMNEPLRKRKRAENYVGLAEAWLESVAGEEHQSYQRAFLEDLYPGCKVGEIEAQLPLEGFGGAFRVHVHMFCDEGVFSVIGLGDTYEAALYAATLNGNDIITDRFKDVFDVS